MNYIVSIICALIPSLLALVGVILTNSASNKKMENQIVTAQAVTDTKLENLTTEVKKHNDFGTRIPILEDRLIRVEQDLRELKDK